MPLMSTARPISLRACLKTLSSDLYDGGAESATYGNENQEVEMANGLNDEYRREPRSKSASVPVAIPLLLPQACALPSRR